MNVKIINSGSKGNSAVIDDAIVIDAGWPSNVDAKAVFITHQHGDHVKHLDQFDGLQIYALERTIDKLRTDARFMYTAFNVVEPDEIYKIIGDTKTYVVKPFEVVHDVPCVGYEIMSKDHATGEEYVIFFSTDFNTLKDEEVFINALRDKRYEAIYIEANNTLSPQDFFDIDFPEEGQKVPKDAFHRTRSYRNHCNVDYLISLFERAGYSEDNKFTEPVNLLHKSSYYYSFNPKRVVDFCKIANIKNPMY